MSWEDSIDLKKQIHRAERIQDKKRVQVLFRVQKTFFLLANVDQDIRFSYRSFNFREIPTNCLSIISDAKRKKASRGGVVLQTAWGKRDLR